MSLQTHGTISTVSFEDGSSVDAFVVQRLAIQTFARIHVFPSRCTGSCCTSGKLTQHYRLQTCNGCSLKLIVSNLASSRDEELQRSSKLTPLDVFCQTCSLQLLLCHHTVTWGDINWHFLTLHINIYLADFTQLLLEPQKDFCNIFHAVALPKTGKQTLMWKSSALKYECLNLVPGLKVA